jgi:hypothetical protein
VCVCVCARALSDVEAALNLADAHMQWLQQHNSSSSLNSLCLVAYPLN